MGRIKSLMVKRTAKTLIGEDEALFQNSFEHNKKVLKNTMPSKPIRNKIAGYLARLAKMNKQKLDKEKAVKLAPAPVAAEKPQYEQ